MSAIAALRPAIEAASDGFDVSTASVLLVGVGLSRVDAASTVHWHEDLAAAERQRASQLRDAVRRASYIAAHVVLRLLLARVLGCDHTRIAYRRLHGKPYVDHPAAQPGFDFSLAHAAGMALIGLRSGGRIGVDIERLDHTHPLLRHRRRVFSSEEAKRSQTGTPEALFRHWTRKESYLKACGTGLVGTRLSDLTTEPHHDTVWRMRVGLLQDPDAIGHDVDAATGYCGAVCLVPAAGKPSPSVSPCRTRLIRNEQPSWNE